MKRMAVLLSCSVLLFGSTAAFADETHEGRAVRAYRKYHKFCYWPLNVLAFIVSGPGVVIGDLNQHYDDKLYARVEGLEFRAAVLRQLRARQEQQEKEQQPKTEEKKDAVSGLPG